MSYYLAPCLVQLRDEINARWPNRDKASDGWIGDARHQASKSDHNPNSRGSVDAIDIDEDGIDIWAVFAAVKKHPSARYWIYERKLYHRLRGWKPEDYDGVNPHDKHAHLSIEQDRDAEQDRRSWGIASAKPSAPKPSTPSTPKPSTDWTQELIMSLPTIKDNSAPTAAKKLAQASLAARGFPPANTFDSKGRPDGHWGPGSVAATKNFQRAKGLTADGIPGPKTWTRLIKG